MDELEKYYNYLKQNGADVPDTYASFKATLSDGSSGETYYNYLKKNGFDTPPTYESFATTFGLKKKDTPQSTTTSTPTPNNSANGSQNVGGTQVAPSPNGGVNDLLQNVAQHFGLNQPQEQQQVKPQQQYQWSPTQSTNGYELQGTEATGSA